MKTFHWPYVSPTNHVINSGGTLSVLLVDHPPLADVFSSVQLVICDIIVKCKRCLEVC